MSVINSVQITKYEYRGVLYDTKAEAQAAYQSNQANRAYLMFDETGKTVTNPMKAIFLYFPGEKDANDFIETCEEQDAIYDGIEPNDMGLFAWSSYNERYNPFDDENIEGLVTVINKLKDISQR